VERYVSGSWFVHDLDLVALCGDVR
jgi:hypothetical protein